SKTPRARRAPGCHPRPAETHRDPRPPDRKGVQASHFDLDVGAGDPHRVAPDLSSRRRAHDSPSLDVEPRAVPGAGHFGSLAPSSLLWVGSVFDRSFLQPLPPGSPASVLVVQGLTPGLSTKNCLFSAMKCFHCSGVSSSTKIAFTGHTGSQAPQSIHSSGWMKSWSGPSRSEEHTSERQ